MTKTKHPPEMLDTYRSTWVELDNRNRVGKITTHPRFRTEWRGTPAVVTIACDRYRLADYGSDPGRLTDWRAYASEARAIDLDGTEDWQRYHRGDNLTDTARARLGEQCRPLALAWLDSPAFAAEYRRALVYALIREIDELRPSSDPEGARALRAIETNAADLGARDVADLKRLVRRFTDWAEARNALSESIGKSGR